MQRLRKYRWEIAATLLVAALLCFLYRPVNPVKTNSNMVCKNNFHCPEVSLFPDKLLEKFLTGW